MSTIQLLSCTKTRFLRTIIELTKNRENLTSRLSPFSLFIHLNLFHQIVVEVLI